MIKFKNGVLALNMGSSSIKFCAFDFKKDFEVVIQGSLEIGQENSRLHFHFGNPAEHTVMDIEIKGPRESIHYLTQWIPEQISMDNILGIGHRLVQGFAHKETERVGGNLLDDLKTYLPADPDHLPGEIELIEAMGKAFPEIPQWACFDTLFHKDLPELAKIFPIPRKYYAMGIQRYGFHGISYEYILEELGKIEGDQIIDKKIILAHLGSGASMVAVKNGKSLDTSMGYTPVSGFMMGTRSGDLDPGITDAMIKRDQSSPEECFTLLNKGSGLLGVSERSSDMRILKKFQETDSRAKQAIQLFAYQVKKFIGSYASVLNGLEILVFSGGIGEKDVEFRELVCTEMDYLGIQLDRHKNKGSEILISSDQSRVKIFVIPTFEELMIAKRIVRLSNLHL